MVGQMFWVAVFDASKDFYDFSSTTLRSCKTVYLPSFTGGVRVLVSLQVFPKLFLSVGLVCKQTADCDRFVFDPTTKEHFHEQ